MNKDITEKTAFFSGLQKSLDNGNFVKVTLGKYRGEDEGLENIYATLTKIKDELRLSFRYKFKTRDEFNNYGIAEGIQIISWHLGRDFLYGCLYNTENDQVLEYSRKRVPKYYTRKPTFTQPEIKEHNKVKKRFVDVKAKYLHLLGITNFKGDVHHDKYDKFRQVDKFIEIVDSLYRDSSLKDKDSLKIIDLGSGKSYLTFALYDYFANNIKIKTNITGVELRDELVNTSNKAAEECMFAGLHFIKGSISEIPAGEADIVAALHACDTATDDAILKALEAKAEIIILAPCCQKYIRKQFKIPGRLKGIFKHGIHEERLAVMITDGLRALFLESKNYDTKVFEFISPEHTARNTMISAVKNHGDNLIPENKINEINAIKEEFAIEDFYLDK